MLALLFHASGSDEVEGLPRGNEYGTRSTRHLLHVVCVSYRRQAAAHADPHGAVLVQVADAIALAQGTAIKQAPHGTTGRGGDEFRKLPARVAVFVDWVSLRQPGMSLRQPDVPLVQADEEAPSQGSADEQNAIEAARQSAALFFAHSSTTVLLLSSSDVDYAERGWASFECHVAELCKRSRPEAWPLLMDASGAAIHAAARRPPCTVDGFRALVSTKAFTHEADREVVVQLYAQVAHTVQHGARELSYDGVGWGHAEVEELCGWLVDCPRVETLSIALSPEIGDTAVGTLLDAVTSEGALASLRKLSLRAARGYTQISDAGLAALTALVEQGWLPHLAQLDVTGARASVEAQQTLQDECERRQIACVVASQADTPSRGPRTPGRLSRSFSGAVLRSPGTPAINRSGLGSTLGSSLNSTASMRSLMMTPQRSRGGRLRREAWRPGGATGQRGSGLASPLSKSM